MSADGSPPEAHRDRVRWNAKYADGFKPSFRPHPLAVEALAMDLPDGPVADLACGASGSALLAAAHGRPVTAVDISELALGMLGDEARRRGLGGFHGRGPERAIGSVTGLVPGRKRAWGTAPRGLHRARPA